MASAATNTTKSSMAVRSTYRALSKLIRRLPVTDQESALSQLRSEYRQNANASEEHVPRLIEEAGKKIAYLRIITPKDRWRGDDVVGEGGDGTRRWVYRSSGETEEGGSGTARKTGHVVSNWDGNNLDPCSVKRHNATLKRAGFVNNLHAKGLF